MGTMIGYGILIFLLVIVGITNIIYFRRSQSLSKEIVSVEENFQEMVRFLHRFSYDFVKSKDERQWMQSMADYLTDAMDAKVIRIYLLEQQQHLRLVANSGKMPLLSTPNNSDQRISVRELESLLKEQLGINESIIGKIVTTGNPVHEDFLPLSNDRRNGLESFIAAPMIIGKRRNGVICAINKKEQGTYFTEDDKTLLNSLSAPIALAGSLFHIYADLSEQQRIQQELRLAREIQNSLLPRESPESEWFSIYGVHKAATEVSGDFYDFVEIDDNFLLVVIADASGKGVPACMVMAMCRTFIRANAARFMENLEGLFKELNKSLFGDTDEAKFVTLACCLIDKRDSTVEYARAGHTELLLRRPTGTTQVISPYGPALGLFPPNCEELEFDTFAFSWLPDTVLVLFTDGLTEALNQNQEQYGLDRLISTFNKQTSDPSVCAGNILSSIREYSQQQPQTDDQTIVVLQRKDAKLTKG